MRKDLPVLTIASVLPQIASALRRRRPRDLCCADLAAHLDFDCHLHRDPLDCADAVIFRDDSGRIGLPIHDGGSSYIAIRHCPWCGARLRKEPATRPRESEKQHVATVTGYLSGPKELRRVLEHVSDWAGDEFSETDWHTVQTGLETDGKSAQGFSYALNGWFEITAHVAKEAEAESTRLRFVGEIDDILATRIETLFQVLR